LVEEERLLMDIDRSNYSYTFTEYEADVRSLRKTLSEIKNIHLVAVYRGSIPVVVHLSNVLNCEMSIIRLHKSNENVSQIEFVSNNIKENHHLVLVEDIYDTGRTIKAIQQMMEVEYNNHTISYYSLFGKENDVGVVYLNEKKKKWVTFPWER
jgi:hypoxanthine-guanine phosphoribosyltransferase